jgi:hypothetical protein
MLNLPSTIPVHASQMYSKNIQNFLALMIDANGVYSINLDDDIVRGTIITHEGTLLHEGAKARMQPTPEPEQAPPVAPESPPPPEQPTTETTTPAATSSQDAGGQQASEEPDHDGNEHLEDAVTSEPAEGESLTTSFEALIPSEASSKSVSESSEAEDSSSGSGPERTGASSDSNTGGGA